MGAYRKLRNVLIQKLDELPNRLTYHGKHHTMDVVNVCNQYIRRLNLDAEQSELLRVAALLHDMGFLHVYKNHEEKSVEMAKAFLPDYGYNARQIKIVEGLIMATKVPQNPQTELEKIICDADLDYLGRDDFEPISDTLFEELKNHDMIKSKRDWDNIQVNFLEKHSYHTDFAQRNRSKKKKEQIEKIKKRLS